MGFIRLGHKSFLRPQHQEERFRKVAQGTARLSQKVGGAMATAGGVMSATGIGATIGAPLAAVGGGLAGVGGVIGGVERLTREKDTEGRLDATKDIIVGGLATRSNIRR